MTSPDRRRLGAIAGVLKSAGYTDKNILARLQLGDFLSLKGTDVPVLLGRTAGGTPLDTLVRLFLIEAACGLAEVREAVGPTSVQDWVDAGLFSVCGNEVRPAVKLIPFRDILVAFDLPGRLLGENRQDYVMGIGSSTITLYNLTIRRPSRLTLDLGTGCGIHALLAASHSDRVVATDINPRAVRFAALNAALNGMGSVECRRGDLFEPVQGLAFDLVVTNPPFVISPERAYVYRDGGMEADRLCRTIVQRVPAYLAEGGFCQILCNWAQYGDTGWKEGLSGWFEGTGCDAWVMRSEHRDIATYASTWIRHTEKAGSGDFPVRFNEWMRYYEHLGISHVSAGTITLRKRSSSKNWFRADEAPDTMLGPCGGDVLRGFGLTDFLESSSDEALLDARPALSPDARLERVCAPEAGRWTDERLRLYLCRGLAYSGDIDPFMADALALCTGERTVREIIGNLAAVMGASPEALAPAFLGILRSLISRGFLAPGPAGRPSP